MELILDEAKQHHLYICLQVGAREFNKQLKGAEALELSTAQIQAALSINAELRRELNPNAEEEAREKDRAKQDPAQLSIEDQAAASSGALGGGHPAGETFKTKLALVGEEEVPPTDDMLRDNLMLTDRLVLLADIRGWTSTERDAAQKYAQAIFDNPESDPEEPECVGLVALSQERMDELNRMGPYTTKGLPEGADDSTSTLVLIPEDAEKEQVEVIFGEYVDGVEAEVKAARLNREHVKHSDIDPTQIAAWLAAGPWTVASDPVEVTDAPEAMKSNARWYVVHEADDVREQALSLADAEATAAKYNRTIAGRDEVGEWRQPPIVEPQPEATVDV